MLSLFRTNQLLTNLLLLFYVAVLYIHVFVIPQSWEPSRPGILAYSVYGLLPWNSLTGYVVAAVLVLLQAILINFMVSENRLNTEITLFPGLFYILIASCIPEFTHLSPVLMANTFYIIALVNVMMFYNNPKSAGAIFNTGFWIGVGSLFYFSYAILILVGFMGLNILRAFNIRERMMILAGAFVPYFLLGVYYFWYGQLEYFFSYQISENISWFSIFSQNSLNSDGYIKLGFISFLIFIVIASYNQNISRRVREVQKKVGILYWMLLLAILSLFFQADMQLDHLLIIAFPLGILLSFNFTQLQASWAELLHFFLLLIVLFFQYRFLIF